jgi:hypothetical protein
MKFRELVNEIKTYESDTFFGGNLSDTEATKIALRLIEILYENHVDGIILTSIYNELFED